MGNKKSRLKRGLVLALTLALVGNGMSSTMLTALAEETEGKVTGTSEVGAPKEPAADQPEAEGEKKDTQAGQKQEDVKSDPDGAGEKKDEKVVETKTDENKDSHQEVVEEIWEVRDLGEIETSAELIRLFRLDPSVVFDLKDGNYENWIDRVNIPAYAKELYNTLVEGSDNDGAADILIDDKYYSSTNTENILSTSDSIYNVVPITKITGDEASVRAQFDEISSYVRAVYDAFDRDHPEVFWLTGSNLITRAGVKYSDGRIESTVYFILKRHVSDPEKEFDVRKDNYQNAAVIKTDIAEREAKTQAILKGMPTDSVYDKVTYFNDWLTKNNEYNTNVSSGSGAYAAAWECMSALRGCSGEKGPVCEGYARAFKVLCDKGGIPCVLVDGKATSGPGKSEAHMWNYVKVDGAWYAIDVTWNDPVVANSQGVVSGYESKEWSLLGSESVVRGMKFIDSHPVSNKASSTGPAFVNGPELSKTAYVEKADAEMTFSSTTVETIYTGQEAAIEKPTVKIKDKDGNTSEITNADITYSYKASGDKEFQSGLPVNAGSYIVKASLAATDTYSAAEAEMNLAIVKKSITITAADQVISYGGSIATGVDKLNHTELAEGELISAISLTADGKNAGSYSIRPSAAVIKRGNMDVTGNYNITYQNGTLTINKLTEYTVDVIAQQNILNESGKFNEPSFKGIGEETVEGTISYTYNGTAMDYKTLVDSLSKLAVGATGTIDYVFVPDQAGNYTGNKTGSITFTIKDIEFTVDNKPATVSNAVTIKSNPVYGDQWSEIVKITSTITAKAGNGSDAEASHFKLSVSGIPNAGEQSFQVLYNGTVDGKKYTDAVVCEGKVNIAKRTLKVLAGDYKVTKVYDGTTSVENVTTTGELKVDGILTKDTDVKVNGILDGFTNPNAGIDKEIKVNLALTGQNAENYKLENDTVAVSCAITPQSITPTVAVNGSYTYTGTAVIPEIVVMNGQSILDAAAYEVSCSNNVNAGQAAVTVSPKAGGNYTWTPVKTEFAIGKAEYDNDKRSASQSTKYGNADTYNLASILPEGAKLGTITAVDEFKILEAQPSVKDNVLSYKLSAGGDQVGQTATITIPVTETTNYNPFDITFTITVADKESQNDFKFDVTELKKTYGDGDFAVVAANAAEGSTVTYKSSEPSVATVDAASGNVHILRKGTTTITATASETNDYLSKSISYTLTVSPKALTWDVSGLQAVDKQGTIDKDTKKASLYGELRVSGIVPADNGKVSFSCPAGKDGRLTGTYADTKPGAQKVTLTWADEPVVLTGTDVDNYTLPAKLPEITGRINAVTEQTNVPESTDTVKYKLEVEDGISQVPDTLVNNPELNTPAKIEEKMKSEIRVSLKEESNQNSIEVYDVVLMVKDGDGEWEVATEENFPKDGLTVTLPYPEGTGKDTHNFEIAHMFTHNWNGREAGQIEHPKASKINEGIQFKVTSLSPIAIGWKEIKSDNTGANGNTNTNATTPNKSRSPQTGDENVIMLYVLLMMLGAAGVGYTMKRRATR